MVKKRFLRCRALRILVTALTTAVILESCNSGIEDSEALKIERRAAAGVPTSWTAVTLTSGKTVNSVAYGNSVFVAVGADSSAAWSSDGISWTSIATPPAFTDNGVLQNMHVYFGRDYFIAFASSSGQKAWAISSDGINWAATGSPTTNFNAKGGVYGNRYYLISGSQGRIAYTQTPNVPSSWTILDQTQTTFSGTGPAAFINALAYGASEVVFEAGGGSGHAAYASPLPSTWAGDDTSDVFPADGFINAIAYGVKTFVAVGGLDAGPGIAAWSTPLSFTWEPATSMPISANAKINCVCFGDGLFLLADSNGDAAYSEDYGKTWTKISTTTFNIPGQTLSIESAAYGAGKFVMAGEDGRIAYSQ